MAILSKACKPDNFESHYFLLYGPFLWMGFNWLKATATSRSQFTFYHSVPRNSWYSFYRPRKDERLSKPQSHLVVLNSGPLDWESSALTTWPCLPGKEYISGPHVIYVYFSSEKSCSELIFIFSLQNLAISIQQFQSKNCS